MTALPKSFATYLKIQGLSPVTIKNYLSDLNHFLAWTELYFKARNYPFSAEPQNTSRFFRQELVEKYRHYLTGNNLPSSTVNRRLSTLRALARFSLAENWIKEDPLLRVNNLMPVQRAKSQTKNKSGVLMEEFRLYLENQKTSKNTIKNYLCDIRAFLSFVESGRISEARL